MACGNWWGLVVVAMECIYLFLFDLPELVIVLERLDLAGTPPGARTSLCWRAVDGCSSSALFGPNQIPIDTSKLLVLVPVEVVQ